MVANIVAQDLQNMTHWGGVRANIQCTLASKSKLKSIAKSREKSGQEEEPEISFPKTRAGKYTNADRRNDGKDDEWDSKLS